MPTPSPFAPPSYLAPSYTPGELAGSPPAALTVGVPGPYCPPSYLPASYCPPALLGVGPALTPTRFVPTLFGRGLETFLVAKLGVPVWALKIPQRATTYPQLVYTVISDRPYTTLAGAAGLSRAEVQIDAYGDDLDCEILAETVRSVLQPYRSLMGDVSTSGCRLTDRFTAYDPNADGSDDGTYRVVSLWTIFYRQSIPS